MAALALLLALLASCAALCVCCCEPWLCAAPCLACCLCCSANQEGGCNMWLCAELLCLGWWVAGGASGSLGLLLQLPAPCSLPSNPTSNQGHHQECPLHTSAQASP